MCFFRLGCTGTDNYIISPLWVLIQHCVKLHVILGSLRCRDWIAYLMLVGIRFWNNITQISVFLWRAGSWQIMPGIAIIFLAISFLDHKKYKGSCTCVYIFFSSIPIKFPTIQKSTETFVAVWILFIKGLYRQSTIYFIMCGWVI